MQMNCSYCPSYFRQFIDPLWFILIGDSQYLSENMPDSAVESQFSNSHPCLNWRKSMILNQNSQTENIPSKLFSDLCYSMDMGEKHRLEHPQASSGQTPLQFDYFENLPQKSVGIYELRTSFCDRDFICDAENTRKSDCEPMNEQVQNCPMLEFENLEFSEEFPLSEAVMKKYIFERRNVENPKSFFKFAGNRLIRCQCCNLVKNTENRSKNVETELSVPAIYRNASCDSVLSRGDVDCGVTNCDFVSDWSNVMECDYAHKEDVTKRYDKNHLANCPCSNPGSRNFDRKQAKLERSMKRVELFSWVRPWQKFLSPLAVLLVLLLQTLSVAAQYTGELYILH